MIFLFIFLLLSIWGVIVFSMPVKESLLFSDVDSLATVDNRKSPLAVRGQLEASTKATIGSQSESFVKRNAIKSRELSLRATVHDPKDLPCASHIQLPAVGHQLRRLPYFSFG